VSQGMGQTLPRGVGTQSTSMVAGPALELAPEQIQSMARIDANGQPIAGKAGGMPQTPYQTMPIAPAYVSPGSGGKSPAAMPTGSQGFPSGPSEPMQTIQPVNRPGTGGSGRSPGYTSIY
jgi:hypothetical protein